MKILVCGCRKADYHYASVVEELLDPYLDQKDNLIIIQGDGDGIDELARDWAHSNYVACLGVPADWGKYQKRAGPIRNSRMISYEPDIVYALPSKRSVGTWDTVRKAEAANIRTIIKEI